MAICSFADRATEVYFLTGLLAKNAGWAAVKKIVRRKLDMIHYAHTLNDLRSSPGNRLETLTGELNGYHSIRVNNQWRVVFRWSPAGPAEVHVCDYH